MEKSSINSTGYLRTYLSVEVRCYANGMYEGPFIHIHPRSDDPEEDALITLEAKQFQKIMKSADQVVQAFNDYMKAQKNKKTPVDTKPTGELLTTKFL